MSGENTGSESQNTNTANAEGEASPFGTAVSFDEVERITDEQIAKKATKVDKALNVGEGDKGSGKKAGDDKNDDEDPDKGGDDAAGKEKKAGDAKEKQGEAPKNLKIKSGDKDLDVAANAKVTVKVDGKDQEFELQDVLNEFSGKTNWGKKYQELDTEKKSFAKERDEFNNERTALDDSIDTLSKLSEQNPMEAVAFLVDLLGGDGIKKVQELQSKMYADFEALAKLTPEQRAAKQADDRANLLQKKIDNGKNAEAKKTEQSEIAKRVDTVKTQHKMTDQQFAEVFNTLKATVKPENLTPELVGDVYVRMGQMDAVDEIVSELKIEDKTAVKTLLDEWQKDRTLTKVQIKLIAEQVFKGTKKTDSALQKKIERNGGGSNRNTSTETKNKTEPITFDDL